MNKTLTVVIPKQAVNAIKPPPNKREVIDALVRIELAKRVKKMKDGVARRQLLKVEIENELMALVLEDVGKFSIIANVGSVYREPGNKKSLGSQSVVLSVSEKQIPKPLRAKIIEWNDLPRHEYTICEKSLRKEITSAVNQIQPHDERVNALLKDEGSRAALEKMAEAIL